MYIKGYKNLKVNRAGVLNCTTGPRFGARFEVDCDLRKLFPYINASYEGAKFFGNPERVYFVLDDIMCTLYSSEIIAAPFQDQEHAKVFADKLIGVLNDFYDNRSSIAPNHKKLLPLQPLDIYKLLPQTNCRDCGFGSCLAFAGAVSKNKASPAQCPGFSKPISEQAIYPVFDKDGNLVSTIQIDINDSREKASPQTSLEQAMLTEREIHVLKLLAEGATNPEISTKLSISPHTVKTHVGHIFDKLGVNDRTQAAVWASRNNLV